MKDLKLTDLIFVCKNVLTNEQCDSLIKEYEDNKQYSFYESCPHAITGLETQSTFTCIELIPRTESFNLIHSKTNDMINQWIEYLDSFHSFHIHSFKRLVTYSHKLRLMKYDTGCWIHPHVDWEHFVHGSCTFALNDNYEGGEFSFFNGNHKIKLNKGDAMIFPADCFWVHEVEPITKGIRYSTNSFITSLQEDQRVNINNWVYSKTNEQNVLKYNIK